MSALIDLNDVPHVAPKDLMRIMQTLIATENGLIFLKGLNDDTRAALEDAIWTTFADQPEQRLAVMVRFECLIEVFASRRLKDQFTLHGLSLLAPAFGVASRQRLNTTWGFNPQKFLLALLEKLNTEPQPATQTGFDVLPPRATQNEETLLAA